MKRILVLLATGVAIAASAHAASKSEPAFTDTFRVDKADPVHHWHKLFFSSIRL